MAMRPLLAKTATATQTALGLLFTLSALAKLVGIETFELYLYTLSPLPFAWAQLAARIVIAIELWLSILLTSHRTHRLTLTLTLLTLSAFTLLLAVLALQGRTDNCHCMGELTTFTPTQSILKNAVLILLALFALHYGTTPTSPHHLWIAPLLIALAVEITIQCGYWGTLHIVRYQRTYLYIWMAILSATTFIAALPPLQHPRYTWLLLLIPLATTFIQNPPDTLYPTTEPPSINTTVLQRQLRPGAPLHHPATTQGTRIAALYSPTCHYCHMAAQKISTMQAHLNLPDSLFTNILPLTTTPQQAAHTFYTTTHTPQYTTLYLPADTFLTATRGQFPIILFLQNGTIHSVHDYRDLSEQNLTQFLHP